MNQDTQNPELIERDIERTQNDISDTVNELQDKLQPRQLLRQVVGNKQIVPSQIAEPVKRNPLAAGMVAVGSLWLLSGKESKMPSFRSTGGSKPHRQGYESHMSTITRYEGESEEIYQNRLDAARADYFGTAREADEEPHSFRERLNSLGEGLKSKTPTYGSNSSNRLSAMGGAIKDRGRGAMDWSSQKHDESPLVMGVAAAAVGAIAALALPKTQAEREKLAPLRDTAMNKASQLKDKAMNAAQTKLDQKASRGNAQPEKMAG